ncbi:MAG TPA: hypothetical protein VFF14_03425 [Candidatus Deferrimicrobium sp.]|nr:hypothetical protein [Candidatus Deferrimicrobium sp.]
MPIKIFQALLQANNILNERAFGTHCSNDHEAPKKRKSLLSKGFFIINIGIFCNQGIIQGGLKYKIKSAIVKLLNKATWGKEIRNCGIENGKAMGDASNERSRCSLVVLISIIMLLLAVVAIFSLRIFPSVGTPTETQPPAATEAPTAAATEAPAGRLPEFPWPPPKPSAIASLTLGSLRERTGTELTFHNVDARISQALVTAGYDEKSYFGVPHGFAIVTRLEQMNLYGYPDYSDRWVSSLVPIRLTDFSIWKYLDALFGVPKGHYRIFVFIITSEMIIQSGTPVTQGEAETWFIEGANKLPRWMETLPYTDQHTCTVYIYEFVQSGVGANANQNIPSAITGKQHLERAGLWDILEK